jgi:hypothetical protein
MTHALHQIRIQPRILGLAAVALAAVVAATGVWLHGAGTASAPEPAKLTGTMGNVSTLAPAVYLSGASTTILRWPSSGSARADGTPRAGQPCTTVWLPTGATTKQVIVAVGSSRFCY